MRWMVFLAAFVLALTSSNRLLAQADRDIPQEEFSANRFTPAPGANNYVTVEGAMVTGHLAPRVGLVLDYAHRPLVLYDATCEGDDEDDCVRGDSQVDLVKYIVGMNLTGALTFLQRFEVGLVVPFAFIGGDSFNVLMDGEQLTLQGGDAFGMGDLRLSGKARILGKGSEGFFLAAVLFGTAPLGHATAEGRYLGHDGFTGGFSAIAEFRIDRFRFGYNMGATLQQTSEFLTSERGSEITYGVGAGVAATPLLEVMGELAGAFGLSSDVDENPMELRLAAQLRQGDFMITGGGGLGLIAGVGSPNFRVLAGVAWQPHGVDGDDDGIRDDDDSCPSEAEDFDGYLDEDGCPDEDNDGDGVVDEADRCPDEREDADGFQDDDGCPDPDDDGDGIEDGYDSCPKEPEDMDGDRDDDGCPDFDTDRDGINDEDDKCPNEPEDTDGFGDEDGCPEQDFDEDGIPDDEDECPDQAEDKDDFEDTDGCPEEGEATTTRRKVRSR